VFGEDAGGGRRGDLADRVTGDAPDLITPTAVEQRAEGEQSGRDDERLGDLRVTDGAGVGDGAVGDQVDADRL
jgi:hypothetical protein